MCSSTLLNTSMQMTSPQIKLQCPGCHYKSHTLNHTVLHPFLFMPVRNTERKRDHRSGSSKREGFLSDQLNELFTSIPIWVCLFIIIWGWNCCCWIITSIAQTVLPPNCNICNSEREGFWSTSELCWTEIPDYPPQQ